MRKNGSQTSQGKIQFSAASPNTHNFSQTYLDGTLVHITVIIKEAQIRLESDCISIERR